MRLFEIERLTKNDYSGGKSELDGIYAKRKTMPLPGGSGFVYAIEGSKDSYTIYILDTQKMPNIPPRRNWEYQNEYLRRVADAKKSGKKGTVIAKLSLYEYPGFPMPAVRVGAITVDEDYRGRGLAMSLYGIVLTVQKKVLIAGDSQTPGGRQNWYNLASIPGCEVKGFVSIKDRGLKTEPLPKQTWARQETEKNNKTAEKNIDAVMNAGGEYLGKGMKYGSLKQVFAFQVMGVGAELGNAVKNSVIKLYSSGYNSDFDTGLYDQWTGAKA